MRTRRAVAAVVVAGLAAVTAGCSAHPGAAAVVDGHEISEAYLQGAYEDFRDLGSATPGQLLNVLVAVRAGEDVAVEYDIAVPSSEALAALEAAGVDTSEFSAGGVEVARYLAMVNVAGNHDDVEQIAQEMDDARRAADIQVNPRYGAFDIETGTIVDVVPEWLVGADLLGVPVAQ